MELSEKAKELYDLLYTDQFDETKLRNALETGHFSEDDLNTAALWYVEDCREEVNNDSRWDCFTEDYDWSNCPYSFGTVFPEFKSSHMYEAIRVLLEFGLNPNGFYLDSWEIPTNIMSELRYIWNGYVGADTLSLLLEAGGDPSLFGEDDFDDETLYFDVTDDVYFYCFNLENRLQYDALFHYWLVLTGFGGKRKDGKNYLDTFRNFDVSNLKNHRNYYFGAIYVDNDWFISIFDKNTNEEVARY